MPRNLPIIESSNAPMDSESEAEQLQMTKGRAMKVPRHSNHDMKMDANDFMLRTKTLDESREK